MVLTMQGSLQYVLSTQFNSVDIWYCLVGENGLSLLFSLCFKAIVVAITISTSVRNVKAFLKVPSFLSLLRVCVLLTLNVTMC